MKYILDVSLDKEVFEVTVDFEKQSRMFPKKRKINEVSSKGNIFYKIEFAVKYNLYTRKL